jgi:DNA-binding MarR family transcriptional regulator
VRAGICGGHHWGPWIVPQLARQDGISHSPAIAPLFRSENQLAILAELFAGAEYELGVADLARRGQLNETAALREVDRLVEAGLLSARVS